jgi:acetyltransferase-like isoleucine patch superfamily enzyme
MGWSAERREARRTLVYSPRRQRAEAPARLRNLRKKCAMSEFLVDRALVLLGDDCESDPSVLLGYRTGRPIADPHLRVGARARLRSGTVLYAGTSIGDDFQTGHNVVVREQNTLGDHVQIWNNTTIDYGCRIGNNVKIHTNCYVAQFTTLEDDVFMAPGVTIANDLHPGCAYSAECMRGPTLRRGVQVGVNVTLGPWITIGEHAVIGSGAVVMHDVPARALVVGNPARVVKQIEAITCKTGVAPEGHSYHPYIDLAEGV